ncbi:MAG: CDP-diacylglycerol--glycerol-3-phosphate 3-phosphatidyltransferase [Thelocarpon impressellum]|nr:MAG: CDP-diacylglycerol--glycerol-3-phosphate 3-phosphatidyltransferase [Thelocarpon impressellum]
MMVRQLRWAARLRVVPVCRTGIRSMPRRSFSSSSSTAAAAPVPVSQAPASVLGSLTGELDRLAPRFDVEADQIRVLEGPAEFYETLKAKIRNAKSRIYLSTLYIGKEEHELISSIRAALLAQPSLKVSILTDCLRGTREAPAASCASLLAPLVTEFGPDRVELRMYHTPNLTGLRKRLVGRRINEGWGLQHMKLANLSNDYFTNRQDRYHVFSSKEVTEYFGRIHDAVCSISFLVKPADDPAGHVLQWPDANKAPSPLESPKSFISRSTALLSPLIGPTAGEKRRLTDTSVYPLAQLTPLLKPDTSTEFAGLSSVLRALSTPAFAGSRWLFTAGYFNIQPELKALLLASRASRGTVVTASPWANGFYGSAGVSGLLPSAYTLLVRRFLEVVGRAGKEAQIEVKEWRRGTVGEPGGWTYHAKGLWVTVPGEADPSITLVGSSNYTKRSYSLDLEVNALVVTRDEGLRRRLGQEQEWLQEHATPVGIDDFIKTDRRVGITVRVAMWIVSLLGGAL